MAYKLKCNDCSHVFVASSRNASCPRHSSRYGGTEFIEDVLDVAVGVAVGYATGSLIESGVEAAIDVVSSIFDW